jgi:four helix bundle protein
MSDEYKSQITHHVQQVHMNQEKGLDELTTWKKAMEFSVWICKRVIPMLPQTENYALTDQLRRSSQSIPANIAEGYGRFYYQENIRFCYIARGSLEETYSHLMYAFKMGYLEESINSHAKLELENLRRLINGYILYLKKSKPGAEDPGRTIREETVSQYDITEGEE